MTYLKCTSCKARLYSGTLPDGVCGELCPSCGSMLEPVGELGEVLGYRSIQQHGDPDDETRHGAVIYRFGELLAARRAKAEKAALEAGR